MKEAKFLEAEMVLKVFWVCPYCDTYSHSDEHEDAMGEEIVIRCDNCDEESIININTKI